ncbi:hypothetical protein B0T20DRAFT_392672 [Sordaria brevicollis]|uniref:Uncharacterized protein n=1 Tax=Sordaria brevicollis TaxID=83679 RepID=A0AAE0PEB9_SORBR|nr:hypothetical protein B0T20DRAFT_392672 [Sordaria brevicollis]
MAWEEDYEVKPHPATVPAVKTKAQAAPAPAPEGSSSPDSTSSSGSNSKKSQQNKPEEKKPNISNVTTEGERSVAKDNKKKEKKWASRGENGEEWGSRKIVKNRHKVNRSREFIALMPRRLCSGLAWVGQQQFSYSSFALHFLQSTLHQQANTPYLLARSTGNPHSPAAGTLYRQHRQRFMQHSPRMQETAGRFPHFTALSTSVPSVPPNPILSGDLNYRHISPDGIMQLQFESIALKPETAMENTGKRFVRPDTPPSTSSQGVPVLPSSQPPAMKTRRQESGYDPDLSSAVADMQTTYAGLSLDNEPVLNIRPRRSSLMLPPTRIPKPREERRRRKKWVSPEKQGDGNKLPPPTPCPSPSRRTRRRRSFSSSSSVDIENVPRRSSRPYTNYEKKVHGKKVTRSASAGAVTGTRRTGYDADDEESDIMQIEGGSNEDVEMDDVPSYGKTRPDYIRGDNTGYDGNVKMENVPPSYSSSGARLGSDGFVSGRPVLEQREEEGNRIRKRVRSSEDLGQCERVQKWRKIGSGWRTGE